MHGAEITFRFLINKNGEEPEKAIVDWGYNVWGNKYPPFDLDDVIPTKIGKNLTFLFSSQEL